MKDGDGRGLIGHTFLDFFIYMSNILLFQVTELRIRVNYMAFDICTSLPNFDREAGRTSHAHLRSSCLWLTCAFRGQPRKVSVTINSA